ncbi:MAG: EamA family transporter RarD [Micrococcales bacterium]|nr:EamA family transporter RarD [Micrococcales bacterium]
MSTHDHERQRGTLYAFAAYGVWGVFPLYFHALKPAGAWEILSHRIVWTFAFCLVILGVRRDWAWIRQVTARPRLAGGITVAALLIAVNWVVYVAAVLMGRTHEAALGYFLNPLVTVALGVVVLGERLRTLQWVAVGVGAAAGLYLAVAAGEVPWMSLALAFSFGLYGLVKKKVGASLGAMHSLMAETAVLTPIAMVLLAVLTARGATTLTTDGSLHTALLLSAGIVTAIPLLFFAAAARRVPLTTIGLVQFMTPVMQLIIGVVLLHEHMSSARWIGFGIVWIALLILSFDMLTNRPGRDRTDLTDHPA